MLAFLELWFEPVGAWLFVSSLDPRCQLWARGSGGEGQGEEDGVLRCDVWL